jgi:uncharacterized protein YkwD
MAKIKWFLIFILVVSAAFFSGFYFKNDILKMSEGFKTSIDKIQNIDIGSVVSETTKQVLTAEPLNVGGKSNAVILLKSKIIEETNKQRIANGLPALTENNLLHDAAVAKANDMFSNQYFEHISPTGIDPGTLVSTYGYEYIITGENLILGNFEDEAEVVDDWMNSPGHRANILNTSYAEIGVAVIKGNYKGESVWIAVQEFGLPLSTCQSPDSQLQVQIETGKLELEYLQESLNEKKSQIEATDKQASYYNDLINDYNLAVREYNSLAENLKSKINNYNQQANAFNDCVAAVQGK